MGKKKILIIDDERNITAFLKTYLEDTGKYEVQAENSGEDGFKTAQRFQPDLILLDIMMKDMSGDAVADRVKADTNIRRTPIIFLTGIVTKEEVATNGGKIGGYPYIAKPILAMRELLDCIDANVR
jgi:two-component system, OmpR family, alkaline phosphatase synthesis response regulator PhoP